MNTKKYFCLDVVNNLIMTQKFNHHEIIPWFTKLILNLWYAFVSKIWTQNSLFIITLQYLVGYIQHESLASSFNPIL